jgi:hypothetical protein
MAGGLVTRTVTLTSQGANGQTITSTYIVEGNDENNLSQLVPIGTNTEYAMEFADTAVQSVDFVSTVAMTLKFNSSGSPVPDIVLIAGQLLHWDVNMFASNNTLFPNPFTANVTAVYCTCTTAGNLNISVLLQV